MTKSGCYAVEKCHFYSGIRIWPLTRRYTSWCSKQKKPGELLPYAECAAGHGVTVSMEPASGYGGAVAMGWVVGYGVWGMGAWGTGIGHGYGYWTVLSRIGPHWAVMGHIEPYWATLSHIGPHWAILSYIEPYWAIFSQNTAKIEQNTAKSSQNTAKLSKIQQNWAKYSQNTAKIQQNWAKYGQKTAKRQPIMTVLTPIWPVLTPIMTVFDFSILTDFWKINNFLDFKTEDSSELKYIEIIHFSMSKVTADSLCFKDTTILLRKLRIMTVLTNLAMTD